MGGIIHIFKKLAIVRVHYSVEEISGVPLYRLVGTPPVGFRKRDFQNLMESP